MPMVLWSAALSQPIIPAGSAQVCSRRRRSCSGSAARAVAVSLTVTFLLQTVEVAEERPEVLGRQQVRRHQIAGLRGLRVEDPATEMAARIRQPAGADREAAGDVGQIGSGGSAGYRALDRVAHNARPAKEHLLATFLLGILWLFCRAALFLFPAGKVLLGLGNNKQRHMRMLRTTELGALPPEGPRPVSRQVQHVHLTRDQILLAVQVGNPKAVDHVIGA